MCAIASYTNDSDHQSDQFDVVFRTLTKVILGQSSENIVEILKGIIPSIGLKNIAALRFANNRSDDVTMLTALGTYSKDWQTTYFVRRYQEVDPVVQVGLKSREPFDWKSFRTASPMVSAFLADSVRHGAGINGITIPVHNRLNGFGLVSLTSDLPDSKWDDYKLRHELKLEILACLIDAVAQINTKLPSGSNELSRREEQVLIWAARGKTNSDIAHIIDVSYASVRSYIEAARRKLRCVNVTHTVASAIAIGLIPGQALKGTHPREFSENEKDNDQMP